MAPCDCHERPPTSPGSRPRRLAIADPVARALRLDDLEYHRAFDVEARLEQALTVEREALEAGATHLQMRGRLVEADMRLRAGQTTEAAVIAKEVNRSAIEHGPPFLPARSYLVLSSVFESVGDAGSGFDNAVRALELLEIETPARTRGNFLVRLGGRHVSCRIGRRRPRAVPARPSSCS